MKSSIKRLIVVGIMTSIICTLPISKANASWKQNSNNTWSNTDITNGWLKEGNNWYFFENGIMKTGWVKDTDGNWYYLSNDGSMLSNTTTPDGYSVDNNGVWIQNNTINNTNISNVNNVNSNNINNINNGTINNGQIVNNTSIYINNSTNNNVDKSDNNKENVANLEDKAFDGIDGFKQIDNDKYVYYENGKILKNTWKKCDNGYRHFDNEGYLDFNKTIDGLKINTKGLIPLDNKFPYTQKEIFMNIAPYQDYLGKYGAGDLEYITNTYDVFDVKYSIEYRDIYNKKEDGKIITIDNKYNDFDSNNFDCEKIIIIGKYVSRLNLE